MFKRCFLFLFFLFTATFSPAFAEAAIKNGGPALWQIRQGNSHIYLFGTIHVLPENFEWLNAPIRKALKSSQTLVVEVDDKAEADEGMHAMLTMGMAPPSTLPPLTTRVDERHREKLQALLKQSKMPEAALNQFRTWAATLILTAMMLDEAGLSPENGADQQIMKFARKHKIDIYPLETEEEQISIYHALSETEQQRLLNQLIEGSDTMIEDFNAMTKAWVTGDVAFITTLTEKEMNKSEELRKTLLVQRNANWTEWIVERLQKPGTAFIAVGAGHLAGPDSLQNMLAKRGITATRIQ